MNNLRKVIRKILINELRQLEPKKEFSDSDKRLDLWKNAISFIAKKLGVELEEFLGGGFWGIAYKISDNRVLKITTDKEEESAAKYLKGEKNEYLSDIYSTYKIKNHKDKMVIVKEYIEPINSELKSEFEYLVDCMTDYAVLKGKYFEGISEFILKDVDEDFVDFLKQEHNGKGEFLYTNLEKTYEEARKKGVFLSDMSPDNFGIKNGHLCLFDIR